MAQYSPITEEHEWFVGEKKTLKFHILRPDDNSQDITNWELEWVLRRTPSSTDVLLTKTTSDGITITNAVDGRCEVYIDPADTLGVEFEIGAQQEFAHALKRSDGDNDSVLVYGEAVLQIAATR
jgi:hypothetical protein